MARPRKPTEILEITGGFDRHPERRRSAGPKSGLEIGDPPEDFEPDEAACWREFLAGYPPGVLTSADRWTLEHACRLHAKSRRFRGLAAAELGQLRTLLTELGATPASRSKIAAPPTDGAPAMNAWDVPAPVPQPSPGIVAPGTRQ